MIFNDEEFSNRKTDAEILAYAQECKAKIDKKRNYLIKLGTSTAVLQHWDDVNIMISGFETEYTNWSTNYAKATQTKIASVISDNLKKGVELVDGLQKFLQSIIPNETRSNDIEKLKSQVLLDIEKKIEQLSTAIEEKVNTGLNDLINLKAEVGIFGNFGDNLRTELNSATRKQSIFTAIFILSALAVPTSIILAELIYPSTESPYQVIPKLGVAVAFGLISFFAFSQYKIYQMLTFRYKHLIGFLGGGATFISQLVDGDDAQLKSEINHKMASLFMSIDDIMGLIKRNKHPAELSADSAVKFLEKAAKILPQQK